MEISVPTGLALVSVMQAQPLIALADIQAGSQWFQQVLGLASGHGGPEYEMLMDGDVMVAQLHDWGAHDHAHVGRAAIESRGNGVLLWFITDDFDVLMQRVSGNNAVVLDGPVLNPNFGQREVWMSGPEGYVVVVAGPPDEIDQRA